MFQNSLCIRCVLSWPSMRSDKIKGYYKLYTRTVGAQSDVGLLFRKMAQERAFSDEVNLVIHSVSKIP